MKYNYYLDTAGYLMRTTDTSCEYYSYWVKSWGHSSVLNDEELIAFSNDKNNRYTLKRVPLKLIKLLGIQ